MAHDPARACADGRDGPGDHRARGSVSACAREWEAPRLPGEKAPGSRRFRTSRGSDVPDRAISVLRSEIGRAGGSSPNRRSTGTSVSPWIPREARVRRSPSWGRGSASEIRLKPDFVEAHDSLGQGGVALSSRGSWTRRSPSTTTRYGSSLTTPCPQRPWARPEHRGSWMRRSPSIREAIRLKPDMPRPTTPRSALDDQGKLDEAIAEFRAALRLKPDYPVAHTQPRRRPLRSREAGRGYRRIPRGDPAQARPRRAHDNLGMPCRQGKPEEAIAEFREAIRLKPDNARPTTTSARPETRGSWRRRLPNPQRSASSPTTPRPTATSALSSATGAISPRP